MDLIPTVLNPNRGCKTTSMSVQECESLRNSLQKIHTSYMQYIYVYFHKHTHTDRYVLGSLPQQGITLQGLDFNSCAYQIMKLQPTWRWGSHASGKARNVERLRQAMNESEMWLIRSPLLCSPLQARKHQNELLSLRRSQGTLDLSYFGQ